MDLISMFMQKNDQQFDYSDAESFVESILDENGPESSFPPELSQEYQEQLSPQQENCFSPHNLADALFVGSHGIDFNFSDYKNNSVDIKSQDSSAFDYAPSPANSDSLNYYKEEQYPSWSNFMNNPFSQFPNNQTYQNIFQQQSAYLKMNHLEKDYSCSDIFQMDQSIKNEDMQQQILYDLMKQKENYIPQRSNSLSSSSPPSPASHCGSSVPSPTSYQDSELVEQDNLDYLDEEMLINTFQTLADFVNNENIKPPIPTKERVKPKRKRARKSENGKPTGKPRLYNFLREILDDPENFSCIEWVDKTTGLFKFLDSAEVARLWGYRKNKPMMKYENFARSLRTYIAKGILTKPRNKLVYCFAKPLTA